MEKIDFFRAKSQLVPSSHRSGQRLGKKMLSILKPLLENAFEDIISILHKTFPHGVDPKLAKYVNIFIWSLWHPFICINLAVGLNFLLEYIQRS